MAKLSEVLLSQITGTITESDKLNMTASRGSHALAAGINFINMVKESFNEEDAEILTKRFLNAIKTSDPRKFNRGIANLREQQNNKDKPNV